MTATYEQLRRLKNTVMGASHRLALIAQSKRVSADDAAILARVSGELNASIQRLEKMLSSLEEQG